VLAAPSERGDESARLSAPLSIGAARASDPTDRAATCALEAAAFAALDARLDPDSPAPLAVAVSGGGDSIALMHLTDRWARRVGRTLLVLTVDHGLHPRSPDWADHVVRAAGALGRSARVLTWTGPKPPTGLPAAARAARHRLLAEAAREAGARVLLLGHTADDVAESDWMRERGSTLGRLHPWSPSPVWPEGRGLMLLRPLLALSRPALRAWLLAQGRTWQEDPANTDPRFARSRARAALTAASSRAEEAGPILAGCSAGLFSESGPGLLSATRAALLAAPEPRRALSAALLCASGGSRPPRRDAVAALLARLAGPSAFTATLAGARLEARGDAVLFGREPGRHGLPHQELASGATAVWDGRFEVRAVESGFVRPVGGLSARLPPEERRRLAALPPWARSTLPALATQNTVRLAPLRSLVHERLRLALGGAPDERHLG
jgi:tRNA(Ile)-lysidine synthase